MKKYCAVIFAIALLYLAGCGGGGEENSANNKGRGNSTNNASVKPDVCTIADLESVFPPMPQMNEMVEGYLAGFTKYYDRALTDSELKPLMDKGFVMLEHQGDNYAYYSGQWFQEMDIPIVDYYGGDANGVEANLMSRYLENPYSRSEEAIASLRIKYIAPLSYVLSDAEFESVFGRVDAAVTGCSLSKSYVNAGFEHEQYRLALEDAGFKSHYGGYYKEIDGFYYVWNVEGNYYYDFQVYGEKRCALTGYCEQLKNP